MSELCVNSVSRTSGIKLKRNGTESSELPQMFDDMKITKSETEYDKVDMKTPICSPSSNLQTSYSNIPPEVPSKIKVMKLKPAVFPKNCVDIAMLANNWKEELNKWYEESPDSMKSSVFHLGKPLGKEIKEARNEGKKYYILSGSTFEIKINIGGSRNSVEKTELTKIRLLALIHRYLHEAALRENYPESKGFRSSALVGRVEFEQGDPLHKYRFLLGEGFHLNHDMFKEEDEQTLFFLGCLLLDYLSCHSKNSPRYDMCKNIKKFEEYVETSVAKLGDSLLAALRLGGVSLRLINDKLPLLKAMAARLKIHSFGTSYHEIQLFKRLKKII